MASRKLYRRSHSFSRLFALIIGINNYRLLPDHELELHAEEIKKLIPAKKLQEPQLWGAVNDANAICDLVINHFGADPDNITNLRDKQATREGIIRSLTALADDPRIQKDDPILIYYAGHGARQDPPASWGDWSSNDGLVEMICPIDMTVYAKSDTDEEGLEVPVPLHDLLKGSCGQEVEVIPGIPDRTIATLLNQLARSKGNNITVILDCCHSAGASRSDQGWATARMILNPPPILPNFDINIFQKEEDQMFKTLSSIKDQNQDSHVLLAACGRNEIAIETGGSGDFTTALLGYLRSPQKHELTYNSLIKNITLQRQTPQCFGSNMNRLLFDIKSQGGDASLIRGHVHKGLMASIILEAGAVHGITLGTMVAIYKNNILRTLGAPLVTLKVAKVAEFISELIPDGPNSLADPPDVFFAQELYSPLVVFSNQESRLKDSLASAIPSSPLFNTTLLSDITFTEDVEKGEPEVQVIYQSAESSSESRVLFRRNENDPAARYVNTQFMYEFSAKDSLGILNFLRCASQFYRHLYIENPDQEELDYLTPDGTQRLFMSGIDIQFFQLLKKRFDFRAGPGPNMIEQDEVHMDVDPIAKWGMKIRNNTNVNLYLHLFLFNARDLSIKAWYLPATGHDSSCSKCRENAERMKCEVNYPFEGVDHPLKANSEITIGYGDGGASPQSFKPPDGIDIDVVYLKLYFTQQAVDMRSLAQESPFKSAPLTPAIQVINEKEHTQVVQPLEDNKEDKLDGNTPKRITNWSRSHSGRKALVAAGIRSNEGVEKLSALELKGDVWATKILTLIQHHRVSA